MKVVFVPDGGFGKAPGFIEIDDDQDESGKPVVFQRQGYLTFDLECRNVLYSFRADVKRRGEASDDEDSSALEGDSWRRISGIGDIQKTGHGWGRYSLSILGQKTEHHSVSINILQGDANYASAGGMKRIDDMDISIEEGFYVEAHLTPERFQRILDELQCPDASLRVTVELGKFPDFYATWSPSISEGREIKYLDNRNDVENLDEIPKEFFEREQPEGEAWPSDTWGAISINVYRPIRTGAPKTTAESDEESYEDEISDPEDENVDLPFVAPTHYGQDNLEIVAAIHKASRRVSFGLFMVAAALLYLAI